MSDPKRDEDDEPSYESLDSSAVKFLVILAGVVVVIAAIFIFSMVYSYKYQ